MTTMTREDIVRGLAENREAPNGSARNAHAEALAGAAEASDDRALFREALDNLINAYLYSSESSKMLVPFARLLQEYDKDPGAFSDWDAHSLFWQFKWVATAISDSPGIPLESAMGWLEEMERRYRTAGYSERPVREAELWLAHATGQDERAEQAFARWQAADRDTMSDCRACELNGQGQYAVLHGDDAEALDIWKPVLEGDLTCAEEPHRVLATSLLPLLRLGRTDEARSNHLRGYRLARGNDSLLPSVGRHIEFCALTGNESRGLEILAEHAPHVTPWPTSTTGWRSTGASSYCCAAWRNWATGGSPPSPTRGSPAPSPSCTRSCTRAPSTSPASSTPATAPPACRTGSWSGSRGSRWSTCSRWACGAACCRSPGRRRPPWPDRRRQQTAPVLPSASRSWWNGPAAPATWDIRVRTPCGPRSPYGWTHGRRPTRWSAPTSRTTAPWPPRGAAPRTRPGCSPRPGTSTWRWAGRSGRRWPSCDWRARPPSPGQLPHGSGSCWRRPYGPPRPWTRPNPSAPAGSRSPNCP
ncbi:hypothetical protein ACU4GG_21690 [Streptomyces nojiriensis]